MEPCVHFRLQLRFHNLLRDSIRYSGDDGFIMHLPLIALRMGCGSGLN
jgi:hypothetical protein